MRALGTFLIVLLVLFSAVMVGLYLGAQPLTDRLTGLMIRAAHSKLAASGIESRIGVEKSRFNLPGRLTYSGITATGRIPRPGRLGQGWDAHLSIGTARIIIQDLRSQNFVLTLNNLLLQLQPNSQQSQDGFGYEPIDLYIRDFKLPLQIHIFRTDYGQADAQKILQELRKFVQTGRSSLPLNFTGKLFFKIEERPVELNIHTLAKGEETQLELSREDLVKLGDLTEDGLTPTEVELLATHPVDVPKFLILQRYASRTSKEAGQRDPRIPQDAYRHVLWSYLLTKAFGPELAEQITNAHETGVNKKVNTAADHAMDYNNNRVGRDYAATGVSENEILWKVLSDPKVIKSTSDTRAL